MVQGQILAITDCNISDCKTGNAPDSRATSVKSGLICPTPSIHTLYCMMRRESSNETVFRLYFLHVAVRTLTIVGDKRCALQYEHVDYRVPCARPDCNTHHRPKKNGGEIPPPFFHTANSCRSNVTCKSGSCSRKPDFCPDNSSGACFSV
jgi:hypothetical protein